MPASSRAGEAAATGLTAGAGEAIWQEVEYASYAADLPTWRELAQVAASRGRPCRVLDLGCGVGRVSVALARLGCEVTGIDLDAGLVATLRDRSLADGLSVEAVVGDARALELGARFDLVIAPMQLVQLFRTARERRATLRTVARHLRPGGRAGIALLDPADLPSAHHDVPLLPDLREHEGWVYSSQPIAGSLVRGGRALELERRREIVSPEGELTRAFSRVHLTLVAPGQIELEARQLGLRRERRRPVPATADHVGSIVLVLRAP